jgi:Zn-finger nucleic acid-binding protein
MNRKNFAERSGVIVDVCKAHGIWFDHGELPRVLAFVEAGGLREAERRAQEQKRALAKEAANAAHSMSTVDGVSEARDLWADLLRGLTS